MAVLEEDPATSVHRLPHQHLCSGTLEEEGGKRRGRRGEEERRKGKECREKMETYIHSVDKMHTRGITYE